MAYVHSGPVMHKAKPIYLAVLALHILVIVMSYITVFIPWAWKDIAVSTRLWAYPFINCAENTFSQRHTETCTDNDFTAADSVTGGNTECRGFLVSTIVFVFMTVIIGVVTLIPFAFLLHHLWRKPLLLASLVQFGLFLTFLSCMLAWIMWICFAQKTCVAGTVIWPLSDGQAYSYGFILHVIASVISLVAFIVALFGMIVIAKWKPAIPVDNYIITEGMEGMVTLPCDAAPGDTAPYFPYSRPTTPWPCSA